MKKTLMIVAALFAFLVAAAVALPFLIPLDTYKNEAARRVKAMTGRDLVIDGEVKASFYPNLGVKLGKISLSNPPGFSQPLFVSADGMIVEVGLMPLLGGNVQVKQFILEHPVINLEKNAAGKENWSFASEEEKNEEQAAPAEKKSGGGGMHSLGQVKITDGTVTYKDVPAKRMEQAQKVNLELDAGGGGGPLSLKGDGEWHSQKVSVEAQVADVRAYAKGAPGDVHISLKAGDVAQFSFKGKVSAAAYTGQAEFATPSIPKLAAWAGNPFSWEGKTPLSFSARGNAECNENGKNYWQCSFSALQLALDALQADGKLALKFSQPVPEVNLDLASETLDLTPYMPEGKHASLPPFIGEAQAAGWSDEKIDLSGLRMFSGRLALKAGTVILRAMKIANVDFSATGKNGHVQWAAPGLKLYGGEAKLAGSIDAGTASTVGLQIHANGIQVEPFLKEMNGFDRLSGALQMDATLNTSGASQRQFVSALGGSGRISVTDGAIRGVNLAQMVRDVKAVVTGGDAGSQKTDFAELGGSFTIRSGIVNNPDLAMKAPLLRMKGEGTVNLPQETVHYRLVPELVGSLRGQGGNELEGVAVPVLVDGTFEHLTFRPDVEHMLQDAIRDPEKMKQQVEGLKDQLKQGKGGVKELKEQIKKDPEAIHNLLKGLGR